MQWPTGNGRQKNGNGKQQVKVEKENNDGCLLNNEKQWVVEGVASRNHKQLKMEFNENTPIATTKRTTEPFQRL